MNGIEHLRTITNDNNIDKKISSEPVKVCFCDRDGIHVNCSYVHPPLMTQRREEFNMTIAAVDQVYSPVKSKVYVTFDSNKANITLQPRSRELTNKCSNLSVTITESSADSVELILYAEGPCKSIGKSKARLHIYLQPCTCPIGFQLEKCGCVCDPLIQHISDSIILCYLQTQTLSRQTNVWLSYSNESGYII